MRLAVKALNLWTGDVLGLFALSLFHFLSLFSFPTHERQKHLKIKQSDIHENNALGKLMKQS